ncbi:NAD-dependent epimerase/dehydratase family protein [Akkermansiaceae bacterium]|nr:NAD-dependent epimerase/dehydratase family protein [Akkermansiaceae bacterium]
MRILITGICGFVGSTLAEAILEAPGGLAIEITGIDNFSRNGSWLNRERLIAKGIRVVHGDIRSASDLEVLGPFDYLIDAAANPSVLAGVDGKTSSRQLIEHNLGGTINLLEACKRWQAGFILLSTSRVYSIPPLAKLNVEVHDGAFRPVTSDECGFLPSGVSAGGIDESFSTAPPSSLYGSTKVTSETLALEYGLTFDFPVWINRCGVMAGARQFGKPDQGIFAFWIHSWREGLPLKYIGFDGLGHQVRDCLHPRDLAPLVLKQIGASSISTSQDFSVSAFPKIVNLSGGIDSAISLRQLSNWCAERFPSSETASSLPTENSRLKTPAEIRPFDLPWVVLDHSLASETWDWQPTTPIATILEEIATFAETSPQWIASSA